MVTHPCPISGCTNTLPEDGIVCLDCHTLLTPEEFRLLVRTRIDARRASNEGDQSHLRSQLEGYLKSASNRIASRRKVA